MRKVCLVVLALGGLCASISQEINEIIQPGYVILLDSSKFSSSDSICTTKTTAGTVIRCNGIYLNAKCDTGLVIEVNPLYSAADIWLRLKLIPGDWVGFLFKRLRYVNATAPLDSISCSAYRR